MFNYLGKLTNNSLHKNIFYYVSFFSIMILLITNIGITNIGIININPSYINKIHIGLLYYVCFILLIRFNPFIKQTNIISDSKFDRKIAFSAGIILFTTIISNTTNRQFKFYEENIVKLI